MEDAKPAEVSSAGIELFMVINNLTVHEKGGARWIGLPAREWMNDQGVKQYANLIEFRDRATGNRLRDAVLAGLDTHLKE